MSTRSFPLSLPPPPPVLEQNEPCFDPTKPEENIYSTGDWSRVPPNSNQNYASIGPPHSSEDYQCESMESEAVKPNLPPKPPPAYREPPDDTSRRRPPMATQPPDLCPRSAPNFSIPMPSSTITSASISMKPVPKPEKTDSGSISKQMTLGTQAWVQEPKPSGKLVGERLSSLQRKLRSLLTQTQPNVLKDSFTTKSLPSYRQDPDDVITVPGSSTRDQDAGHGSTQSCSLAQQNSLSVSDPRCNYISVSSASYVTSHSHGHEFGFSPPERHPFEPTTTHGETEEVDTNHIRDTCSRLFSSGDPKVTWTAYRSPRSSYSNNIKSAYDYDKLVPKEVIGKPCQEKKTVEPSYTHIHSSYQSSKSYSSLVSPSDHHPEMLKSEPKPTSYPETQYYSLKEVYNVSDVDAMNENSSKKNRYSHRKFPARSRDFNESSAATSAGECGDVSDQYKSSSESGHGTMQSSTKDSKSLVSAPSSGISAASNLDTSLDSDHSANFSLWDNPQSREWTQKSSGTSDKRQFSENQAQQDYAVTESADKGVNEGENEGIKTADGAYSESLSGTPPLPPLSPPPSSNLSESSSPRASPKAKYKLSLSTSALNCHLQASRSECLAKSTECGNSNKQRNGAISPSNCKASSGNKKASSRGVTATNRHWKGGSTSHQRTNLVSCGGGRKGRSSPILRQLARLQAPPLALSSYNEFADLELTSTTTGLDGESIDDPDELSSELSISTSTMDPMEVSLIRKQLEGLETMYSEILHLLGVKNNSCKAISRNGNSSGLPRNSRCRINGSLSSLTARSSNSRSTHNLVEKRGLSEKRRGKDGRNGKIIELTEHAWEEGHEHDWGSTKIMHHGVTYRHCRLFLESWETYKVKNRIANISKSVPECYRVFCKHQMDV